MNAQSERKFGLKIPQEVAAYWNEREPQVRSFLPNTFPLTVDWSSQDSQVKNQSSCGSCWAFVAVALVENLSGQQDLSEQELVSCAVGDCGGGWYGDALKYVHDTGLPPESCYPYQASNGSCANSCDNPDFLIQLTNYDYYGHWGVPTANTVNDLKSLLQTGPVCVSMLVPADGTFDNYSGGVYDYEGGAIPSDRGHAVLVVGYDDNESCFKAKNSWGSSWGENGYFFIAYDDVTDDVQFGGYACTASGAYVSDPTAVELATFDFQVNKNEVRLSWSTVSETENYGFDVERSKDGAFVKIGFVKGFGTTSEPQFYQFSDNNLPVGNYQYRLRQIDFDGRANFSPAINVKISAPRDFRLTQNYPNPFNQETVLYFEVPHSEKATLDVYNMLGQKVKTLFEGALSPGYFSARWNGTDDFSRTLPSGIYYYKLQSGDFHATRRMILVR
ncbi:MAG: T9SS type A sorting domain-containing protein [Calditrichaeota bacterium]|nr:T9SS type A sorting domain-containing protein [Calditrichota bacterium]